MADKPYRSLVKAISYRLTGTLATMTISFLVTGRFMLAFSIGVIELFTKIGIYYLHERIWDSLSFGRVAPRDDYEI